MSAEIQHELIQDVQRVASELGRTPGRDEFRAMKSSRHDHMNVFGSFVALLHAAGLEPKRLERKKKITNEIFIRDLGESLAEYKPLEAVAQPKYTPTLVIPDTHFPFVSQRVLDAIYEWVRKEKPGRVVQIGDLYDAYAHSKFPRSMNVYTPDQEEDLARQGAAEMWRIIRAEVPKAECVQLKGNHDVRAIKRVMETTPALERAVSKMVNELMTFDGVKLIEDARQEYLVEGIEFIHGYRSKLGEHRDYALMHAVCGHIHVGGTAFRRIRGQTLWELNAGLAGDPESKALSYTPQKIVNWTPGFGWIDEMGPRFVPV